MTLIWDNRKILKILTDRNEADELRLLRHPEELTSFKLIAFQVVGHQR